MYCYEKLSSLLGLACHPDMRDWELENANPDRLPEFIHAYQTRQLLAPRAARLDGAHPCLIR